MPSYGWGDGGNEMGVKEIVNELTALAYRLDSMRRHQATVEGLKTTTVLREAATILSAHPDAKPNASLTLEELQEMDGEPVWIVPFGDGASAQYALVDAPKERLYVLDGDYAPFDDYGKYVLAYRRKPEVEKR